MSIVPWCLSLNYAVDLCPSSYPNSMLEEIMSRRSDLPGRGLLNRRRIQGAQSATAGPSPLLSVMIASDSILWIFRKESAQLNFRACHAVR